MVQGGLLLPVQGVQYQSLVRELRCHATRQSHSEVLEKLKWKMTNVSKSVGEPSHIDRNVNGTATMKTVCKSYKSKHRVIN